MNGSDSSTQADTPTDHSFDQALMLWVELERGWQAVVLGFLILGIVMLGIEIPW